jgi:predicted nuclease with TOPRIM domain
MDSSTEDPFSGVPRGLAVTSFEIGEGAGATHPSSPTLTRSAAQSAASPVAWGQHYARYDAAVSPDAGTVASTSSNSRQRGHIRAGNQPAAPAASTAPRTFFSASAQTTTDAPGYEDGVCSRTAYLRLQAQLREERVAFLRELQHLKQCIVRAAPQSARAPSAGITSTIRGDPGATANAGTSGAGRVTFNATMTARSRPNGFPGPLAESTMNSTMSGGGGIMSTISPTVPNTTTTHFPASHESTAAVLNTLDVIGKALASAEALREVHDENSAALAALRSEHRTEIEHVKSEYATRVSELTAANARLERDVELQREASKINARRIRRDAEVAATRFTEHLSDTCKRLEAQLETARGEVDALRTELADRSSQASQQSLLISRLQQQLSEGAHERTEMRAALEATAAQSGTLVAAANAIANQNYNYRRRSSAASSPGMGEATAEPMAMLSSLPGRRGGAERNALCAARRESSSYVLPHLEAPAP